MEYASSKIVVTHGRAGNNSSCSVIPLLYLVAGLGMRDSRLANVSLLGKLVWSLLNDCHKLWFSFSATNISDVFRNGFAIKLSEESISLWYDKWFHNDYLCNHVDFGHISDTTLFVKDVWDHGHWNNLNPLFTFIPPVLKETIQNIQIPKYTQTPDVVRWNGNLEGVYTAASGYQWLGIQSKDALPVDVLGFHRGLSVSSGCPHCSASHETILHCLRDCPFAKEIWLRLGLSIRLIKLLNRDWVVQVHHVLREANFVADSLAQYGSSYTDLDLVWNYPPNFLALALQANCANIVHLR
ncbi:hypothetical protein RIF29_40516 [Crotalaria pallida]|uniref:Reverse transcriptase zinc-binding domain-containing protein n=1 Tax=Crotalaria pallida TaxID=3830 RepID=A0AAN9E398_CROPI